MSWPSFYGYKYTPIGLRQREVKDETGAKTWSTIVHLPQGGHLLDIERRINPDGSVSKTESSCFVPSPAPVAPPSQPRTTPRAVDPFFGEEGRHLSDLERQADDIIANFRARHGTGLEPGKRSRMAADEQDATGGSFRGSKHLRHSSHRVGLMSTKSSLAYSTNGESQQLFSRH